MRLLAIILLACNGLLAQRNLRPYLYNLGGTAKVATVDLPDTVGRVIGVNFTENAYNATGWNNINYSAGLLASNLLDLAGNSTGISLFNIGSVGTGMRSFISPLIQDQIPDSVGLRGVSYLMFSDTMIYKFSNCLAARYTLIPIVRSFSHQADSGLVEVNGVIKAYAGLQSNDNNIDSLVVAPASGELIVKVYQRGRYGPTNIMGFVLKETPNRPLTPTDYPTLHPTLMTPPTLVSTAVSSNVQLVLTYDAPVTGFTSYFPKLKYDKHFAVSVTFDDGNNVGLMNFEGLKKTFNDGTGRQINWRGSFAANGSIFNIGDPRGFMGINDIIAAVHVGHGLINHSYNHAQVFDFVNARNQITWLQDELHENTGMLATHMLPPAQYREYYLEVADSMDFSLISSSNTSSGWTIYNTYPPNLDMANFPTDTTALLGRLFTANTTDYASMLINASIAYLDLKNYWICWGNHGLVLPDHTYFMDSLEVIGGDKMWVASEREVIEYRRMREEVDTSIVISGNTVTITFNFDNVHPAYRWQDISFNVDCAANLVSVSAGEHDDVTYNLGTGKGTIYRSKMEWDTYYPHRDSSAVSYPFTGL